MKKKVLFVLLLVVLIFLGGYYQFIVEPDILDTFHDSSGGDQVSESIDVLLNAIFVLDKESTAEKLLEMRLNNSYHSIMFSADSPEDIYFTVYLNSISKREAFSFQCTKKDSGYEIEIRE